MPLTATWTKIVTSIPLHRSSLALSVVGDKAYIFGGELVPRTPLDNHLFAVDLHGAFVPRPLLTSSSDADRIIWLTDGKVETFTSPSETSEWPSARVGSASAAVGTDVSFTPDSSFRLLPPPSSSVQDPLCLSLFPTNTLPSHPCHALSSSQIYIWGGRGGKAMTPSSGELYKFDTLAKTFSLVPVAPSLREEQPEDRSFHVLTSYEVRSSSPLL
jgi:hypothetical protein